MRMRMEMSRRDLKRGTSTATAPISQLKPRAAQISSHRDPPPLPFACRLLWIAAARTYRSENTMGLGLFSSCDTSNSRRASSYHRRGAMTPMDGAMTPHGRCETGVGCADADEVILFHDSLGRRERSLSHAFRVHPCQPRLRGFPVHFAASPRWLSYPFNPRLHAELRCHSSM
jgi:hypothetical protein